MKIIGITGGTGSGKSATAKALGEMYSIKVINADEISHSVLASAEMAEVIGRRFGAECIDERGNVIRRKLGQIVFGSEEKRKELNSIIHPFVRKAFFEEVNKAKEAKESFIIYDCPLLFEEGLEADVDITILVYATVEERTLRLLSRDGLSEEEIASRIGSQMPLEDKIPLSDIVIYNNGTLEQLKASLPYVYKELCSR